MSKPTIFTENTRNSTRARHVLELLEACGGESRWVGGCVRDRLLRQQPQDYDLATTLLPQTVLEYFNNLPGDVQAYPTGMDYGTVTVVYEGVGVEVTTLRCDITTDGRHAQVRYGTSFEEDARRRDFTINALSQDLSGHVYDYHGGITDLKQGWVRFVGEPRKRIREDYLRVLRFFRFAFSLNFRVDLQALAILYEERVGLTAISNERIFSEIKKIFATLGNPTAHLWQHSTLLTQWLRAKLITTCCPQWHNAYHHPSSITETKGALEHICLQLCSALELIIHPLENAHHLKWVIFAATFWKLDKDNLMNWYAAMKSSRKEAQEASLWWQVLSQRWHATDQPKAFALLNKLEQIRGTEKLQSIKKALQGATRWQQSHRQYLQNPPQKPIPLELQNLAQQLLRLEDLLQLERKGRSIRLAPPLLTARDFIELGYQGPQIGAAQRQLQKLQWQEKLNKSQQAREYFRNKVP